MPTKVHPSSLGTLQTNDCNQNNGYGCSISSGSSTSYGDAFNSVNGGVYATQWTSDYIRIWYFPRSSIPADITSGQPDPANWGLPDGNFQGSCDIDENFANHQIVFDTTFCGDVSQPFCQIRARRLFKGLTSWAPESVPHTDYRYSSGREASGVVIQYAA